MRLVYDQSGARIWSYDANGYAVAWYAVAGEISPIGTESATRSVCSTIIWDAEFSRDGRYWVAADSDGLVHVYQAEGDPIDKSSYSRLYTLHEHTGSVSGTAFNHDGTLLASASYDGTVRLWDMKDGHEVTKLTDQPLPVKGVDFSPDGSRLVTARADGTISVYLMSVEELMEIAQSGLSRGFTKNECQTYLHLPTCPVE